MTYTGRLCADKGALGAQCLVPCCFVVLFYVFTGFAFFVRGSSRSWWLLMGPGDRPTEMADAVFCGGVPREKMGFHGGIALGSAELFLRVGRPDVFLDVGGTN